MTSRRSKAAKRDNGRMIGRRFGNNIALIAGIGDRPG
jgi:hypothetical protein